MLSEIDFVAVVLHLTAAGVDEAHQGISPAERTLVSERYFHPFRLFYDADRERCPGQQFRQALGGRSLKHESHQVVYLIIQDVGNMFALRCCHGKSSHDPLGEPHDVVILAVQLCRHADGHRLGAGRQNGKVQRSFPGQLIAERCGQHPRKAALESVPAIDIQFSHDEPPF